MHRQDYCPYDLWLTITENWVNGRFSCRTRWRRHHVHRNLLANNVSLSLSPYRARPAGNGYVVTVCTTVLVTRLCNSTVVAGFPLVGVPASLTPEYHAGTPNFGIRRKMNSPVWRRKTAILASWLIKYTYVAHRG